MYQSVQRKKETVTQTLIQPQLEIGRENDQYETEADQVADKVMRMAEPEGENKKMSTGTSIQRMTDPNSGKAGTMHTGMPAIQKMSDGAQNGMMAPAKVEQGINSSKGSGQNLQPEVQNELSSKIGTDLSNVNIHTDNNAVQMNKEIGTKAFTHGNDIYFNQGQYNPSSNEGKHLLAHELTHTVQQGSSVKRKIQRKIWFEMPEDKTAADYPEGDTLSDDDGNFYKYVLSQELLGTFDPLGQEILNGIYTSSEDMKYKDIGQLKMEVDYRKSILANIKKANEAYKKEVVGTGCCFYGNFGSYKLKNEYWERMKDPRNVSPEERKDKALPMEERGGWAIELKDEASPSKAVKEIFKTKTTEAKAENLLECASMMTAVQYKSMLDVMGDDAFDKRFKDGKDLLITSPEAPLLQFDETGTKAKGQGMAPLQDPSKGLMTIVDVKNIKDLIPGDWVYFRNYSDYSLWHESGLWSGEHAAYLGKDSNGRMLFSGFGLTEKTYKQMLTYMVNAENDGLEKDEQKDFWNKKGDGNQVEKSEYAMLADPKDVGEDIPLLDSPYFPGVDWDVKRPNIMGLMKDTK